MPRPQTVGARVAHACGGPPLPPYSPTPLPPAPTTVSNQRRTRHPSPRWATLAAVLTHSTVAFAHHDGQTTARALPTSAAGRPRNRRALRRAALDRDTLASVLTPATVERDAPSSIATLRLASYAAPRLPVPTTPTSQQLPSLPRPRRALSTADAMQAHTPSPSHAPTRRRGRTSSATPLGVDPPVRTTSSSPRPLHPSALQRRLQHQHATQHCSLLGLAAWVLSDNCGVHATLLLRLSCSSLPPYVDGPGWGRQLRGSVRRKERKRQTHATTERATKCVTDGPALAVDCPTHTKLRHTKRGRGALAGADGAGAYRRNVALPRGSLRSLVPQAVPLEQSSIHGYPLVAEMETSTIAAAEQDVRVRPWEHHWDRSLSRCDRRCCATADAWQASTPRPFHPVRGASALVSIQQ